MRDAILRSLDDAHNELAHVLTFPRHYTSHVERLCRRVAVLQQIRALHAALEELRTWQQVQGITATSARSL